MTIAITGANGHLGQRLLRLLASRGAAPRAFNSPRALVRSPQALSQIEALGLGDAVDARVVDYADPGALAEALAGCTGVVHLVGIIKETPGNTYHDAHEASCRALVDGAARAAVERIVYLSILGAEPGSSNACLASKGAAERILTDGAVAASVIRVPMVLGEGDYAAGALAARARRGLNVVLRGASLEQPIYAGDVVDAVVSVLEMPAPPAPGYDLAGPESLSRAALTHRAAAALGRRTRVLSLPYALGHGVVALLERVTAAPPITVAMLEVLDHDDCIDPRPAADALGISLTPLDDTLRRCLDSRSPA